MPVEWQKTVFEIVGMKLRMKFGAVVLDKDLSDRQKLVMESFQIAIDKKQEK